VHDVGEIAHDTDDRGSGPGASIFETRGAEGLSADVGAVGTGLGIDCRAGRVALPAAQPAMKRAAKRTRLGRRGIAS
jgi:hypothetical protein